MGQVGQVRHGISKALLSVLVSVFCKVTAILFADIGNKIIIYNLQYHSLELTAYWQIYRLV